MTVPSLNLRLSFFFFFWGGGGGGGGANCNAWWQGGGGYLHGKLMPFCNLLLPTSYAVATIMCHIAIWKKSSKSEIHINGILDDVLEIC